MTQRKRTAIVGAGASGLAMARSLRRSGHNDVVILESGSTAGGKCSTMHHGGRTYELGAAILTPAYKRVREIMAEHDVPSRLRVSAHYFDGKGGLSPRFYVPPTLSWRDFLRVPEATLRVALNEVRRQLARFPRLDLAPSAWYQSAEHWARQQDVVPLLELLRPWATSFGYGFLDEVPALYLLNYMCLLGPSFELHETGFGGLWQRVAERYDVRYSTEVKKVRRGALGVSIETSRGNFEVDDLVIACPLENAARFLDTSDEERSLFSEVRYMDYQVIAANTTGLPKAAYVFHTENMKRDRSGKPVFYYRRYRDTGVVNFYSYRGPDGLDGAEREVISLVESLGGRVKELLARRAYRYFPHVSSEGLGRNFYPRMEALQGQNRTYYAGEVMSFSCVEPVVAYADQLAVQMTRPGVQPQQIPFSGVENDVEIRARITG